MNKSEETPTAGRRRQVRAEAIPVRPIVCHHGEELRAFSSPIGEARSKTEAIRVVREQGWRVLGGGEAAEIWPADAYGPDEWAVKIHRPPNSW